MAQTGTDIQLAADWLEREELVGMPTETVYGLAGNATSEKAVLSIYRVKNRPAFDPLIAHTDSLEKMKPYVKHIPEMAHQLAAAFWPGPLTMLLDKTGKIPEITTSGLPQVAVRIPGHAMARNLLAAVDFPVAAPSANPFGYVSPTTAQHVADKLGDLIPYILDGGPSQVGVESTIVGFKKDKVQVYRLGGLSTEQLETVCGPVSTSLNQSSNPKAPGMLKSHYAPGSKVIITGNLEQVISEAYAEADNTGILSFTKESDLPHHITLSKEGNPEEAARNLFKALRYFDSTPVKVIYAELLPETGLGRAINDRIRRAAAQ